MARPAFTELVPEPATGRVFREPVRAGIDGASATGRVRLDAIARWLQDAAYWDLLDAGWERPAPWFVRRLRLRVERFPAFAEELRLATWCSGIGRGVAERRTSIRGSAGAHVEAVALWIHLDGETLRPAALPERFMVTYAPSAGERRSRTKLHLPATPPDGASTRPFTFRTADVDLAAHVNNAVYWAALEEELDGRAVADGLDVEVEHRAPVLPGAVTVHAEGPLRWIVDAAAGTVACFALEH